MLSLVLDRQATIVLLCPKVELMAAETLQNLMAIDFCKRWLSYLQRTHPNWWISILIFSVFIVFRQLAGDPVGLGGARRLFQGDGHVRARRASPRHHSPVLTLSISIPETCHGSDGTSMFFPKETPTMPIVCVPCADILPTAHRRMLHVVHVNRFDVTSQKKRGYIIVWA